jgi:hypothetical protein
MCSRNPEPLFLDSTTTSLSIPHLALWRASEAKGKISSSFYLPSTSLTPTLQGWVPWESLVCLTQNMCWKTCSEIGSMRGSRRGPIIKCTFWWNSVFHGLQEHEVHPWHVSHSFKDDLSIHMHVSTANSNRPFVRCLLMYNSIPIWA